MLLVDKYKDSHIVETLDKLLAEGTNRVHVNGMTGSMPAVVAAAMALRHPDRGQLLIAGTKEEAYYLLNDIETMLEESDADMDQKRALLFPASYRKQRRVAHTTEEGVVVTSSASDDDDGGDLFQTDNANVLQRSEVVKRLNQLGTAKRSKQSLVVVTYPEALSEKVVSSRTLIKQTLTVARGAALTMDFLIDALQEYDFERVDFVVDPGQYAVRGGIIDVFSFANEYPFRIEFFDDVVDSLRTFDPVTQLSIKQFDQVGILPNLARKPQEKVVVEEKVPLLNYFANDDMVWVQGLMFVADNIETRFANMGRDESHYCSGNLFLKHLLNCRIIETGNSSYFNNIETITTHTVPQPAFNKQFEMLISTLREYRDKGYTMMVTVANEQQQRRLERVFMEAYEDSPTSAMGIRKVLPMSAAGCQPNGRGAIEDNDGSSLDGIEFLPCQISHGFVDDDERLVCFTDHEIFERYHKYKVHDIRDAHQALTLKELLELKPGDYVTHVDYGVGRFSGLEKITNNGKTQEVIRLIYKNEDTLYISIHSLHKISRYVGKEGTTPTLNRLGSNTWQVLKQKTKKQVKDIAKDLIELYAKRKASQGFAYSADSYLQEQLEASFFYEDTPDQNKATQDVKHDMEDSSPMDRLVCGDVGFGKTEVAIRAAFKAVCDSKQVAVLVPNTILAFQHYNTFRERLQGLPVNIDYLNRFRTTKEKNAIFKRVEEGKIDILIGTHAITNKNLKFKDLGLLIIDEEQKFGVAAKEKLRQMKVNVDCLTLTATPIPRTLQFSLMGARDLSVIRTAPPNRQPIQTELCIFDEEVIRDAVRFEMSRGGQTFFISNRVENLPEMAGLVSRLVPDARVGVAHGQMDGKVVEETMMRFLEGDIDVLVATAIIENGLNIPNANTMIINNAQNFGLSDLHQMRGRVGRSNIKAFCYMLIPSFRILTDDAQKRLKAIEEFSSIGSGLNIAMRDLDIRGAGNILGAEQSGFISDIGYDMYHKILNEAIEELKETEFQDLFRKEVEESKEYVKECLIETDLEVLLPDDYVTSVSERLLLYKELNDLETEEELAAYRKRLIDRFGPLPKPTEELVRTITLRRMARHFGIEKLVLKQGKLICHLIANPSNPFYQSPNFVRMIKYVQSHPNDVHLRETSDKLTLICDRVPNIDQAIKRISDLVGPES
ncbi:MAG: transcription-repair coupling factor [Bacteroidales bacterium]|nr:transcription-repair coupling factor [Bacteroidales bacterium]